MEMNHFNINNEFNSLMYRLGGVVASEPGYQNMQNYIRGLLGNAKRKNGWQLSEYVGEETPYALQQFLYKGRFSADELRDKQREYVIESIGSANGILVVDETGFLKQGKESCGVKRQYSGTAGRIENCQIGVFLSYASEKGHCPIDRRLYMPEEWIEDEQRRKKAGVPEELTFKTKPEMALEMVQETTNAGVPYNWVTGDSIYGDYTDIRMWLENQRKSYVMCLSGKAHVWRGWKQEKVSNVMKNLPEEGWFSASCGDGSKGARVYDWLILPINPGVVEGFERSLLIRRSKSDPADQRAYICFAPIETPKQRLVEVAGTRWTVETCFKESKSEVGLDEYEVRKYEAWYKHITLACVALAFLTVLSCKSFDGKRLQEHHPASYSLEEFKKGLNLHV